MSRLVLAVRLFFQILLHQEVAERARQLVPPAEEGEAVHAESPSGSAAQPAAMRRSEAITLLATLQREARLVDFVTESIDGYSDAQIGAAAREVHRGCAHVLRRIFDLQPLRTEAEGTPLDLPADYDAQRFRLSGHVAGQGPYRGRLVHPGWQATQCELPQWTGSDAAANIVAPAEVEIA
jgi:hypothetical protein